jgi:NAD-dependent deacetylase
MIVFLTGSGISADSGLKTFRDNQGLWQQYDIRQVCDIETFDQNKAMVFQFYNERRLEYTDAKPNHAHYTIAKLQQQWSSEHVKIITQNIDHLFEKAGCLDVAHVHGNINEMKCLACEEVFTLGNDQLTIQSDSLCPNCQQPELKPNVVFFNEGASLQSMLEILDVMTSEDMLVVIGTSGMAIPLNAIVEAVPGYKILNNLQASDGIDENLFDEIIYETASKGIEQIKSIINSKAI